MFQILAKSGHITANIISSLEVPDTI